MNKFLVITTLFVMLAYNLSLAQNASLENTAVAPAQKNITKKPEDKKKLSLDFDDEVIKSDNNVPELLLLNSRKLIKYKNLFNKRTNYINEIESNKGLFNDYQQ